MVIVAGWDDPAADEANVQWVRNYSAAISPHSQEGGYVNFLDADDANRIPANYGDNYKRLVDIKRKYDPDNVFHVNQNIVP
jgi:FAD/FMN-containing dehydrogenase